jgi:ABC-2 type transport system permease protein
MSTDRPGATEFSPSDVRADEPLAARVFGLAGLGATTLGVAAVIANQYSPRWIPEGWGYLLAVLGVVLLLYHAIRDGDLEIRRIYGGLGGLLMVTAIALSVVPGKAAEATAAVSGHYFLPWAPLCGLLGLLFGLAFLKHETDERYRPWGEAALLGVGVGCALLAAVFGVATASLPVGPVVVLGLLGLAYLCGYFAQTDTSVGIGYWVSVGVGLLGAGLLLSALGRVIFPTMLFEGAKGLQKIDQTWDVWKIAVRVALVFASLGLGYWGARNKGLPLWLRGVAGLVAVGFAAVFVVGSFAHPVTVEPKGYLVPSGVILIGLGLTFLAVSVGIVSENPLVVLTRRELAAFFYSPIAYLVLGGMVVLGGIGYRMLLGDIAAAATSRGGLPEPLVGLYWSFTWVGGLAVWALVPAITMRAFSEEKRSGTLEVLMTAPVGEGTVVLSKFLASWLFFLVCWIPAGVFLIALRFAGGAPFEFKPVLSFYLAVAASGAGFVAMGLFFSSLTKNQIIAAVLTFVGMLGMFFTLLRDRFGPVDKSVLALLGKFDYLNLWMGATNGRLPVPELAAHLSACVLWLFLTVKVLEARKWS